MKRTVSSEEETPRPRRRGALACPSCGRARPRAARFCPACGAALDLAAAERRVVTVLFADLCDSTALVSKSDPEEAQAALEGALRAMVEAVETYGGAIQRVQGDGIVALFGAPVAHEDHALRACLAALALQRHARETPQRTAAGAPMRVRIGIHSGEIVLGSVQALLPAHARFDGAAIHLAARLEEAAPPGGVLLSAATHGLLDGELDARPLGARVFRGFDEAVELYELVQDSQRSAAGPLARRRALSPLIGRDEALAALKRVAERVASDGLRVLGLVGEAGIGKTRLLQHFGAEASVLGFGLCVMTTRSYTNHLPYSALADLMRALMGLKPDVDPRRERDAALEKVSGWQGAAERHVGAATDLLGLGPTSEAWRLLTPRQRNQRIAEALIWLVQQRLRAGPLLVLIEDIFLADEQSLRALEGLWRRLEEQPVLFGLSYRDGFNHRWRDARWFDEHRLGPLPRGEARQLLASLLGDHDSLQPIVERLVEIGDGNPFFLEQMGLTLVDNASVIGSPGDYRCPQSVAPKLELPISIAAVITARVERLSPGPKAALEALAVLDETVPAELVGAMLGQASALTETHLRLSVSAGLLAVPDEAAPGERAYSFRHALVRTVVAERLTRPRRKLLHRAALHALRAQLGEQAAERASVLAQHALRGEAWAETAQYSLMAMTRSIARSANGAALEMLRQGLAAAQQLDDEATKVPLELALHSQALGALMPRGQFDEMFMHLEQAQEAARRLGDSRREAAAGLQRAVLLWTRGKYESGLEAAAQAAVLARAARSRGAEMAAAQARLMLEHGLGRYAAVVEQALAVQAGHAAELASRRIMPGWAIIPSVNVRAFHADALARMGRLQEGQRLCDEGYRELEGYAHPFSRSMLDFVQGGLWTREGRLAEAIALLRQALADCVEHDLPTMAPCMVGLLGEAMGRHGDTAQAVALVEGAIADKTYLLAGQYTEFYLRQGLGVALLSAGELERAEQQLQAGREHAAAHRQHGHEADAVLMLATAQLKLGHAAAASTQLRQGLVLAERCAMKGVAAQMRALLAEAEAQRVLARTQGEGHA